MRTCCAGFLKRHRPQSAMDLCPARVCQQSAGEAGQDVPWRVGVMARRKNRETSSSMDKGRAREFMLELARVFPSQKKKKKNRFNCRTLDYNGFFLGVLPPNPCFERNRASILTPTKNTRPRAMGHPALGSLASPASLLARACFLFAFRRP